MKNTITMTGLGTVPGSGLFSKGITATVAISNEINRATIFFKNA
ncbi:hypothetical protein V5735_21675 (plasmid) [Haladaptatus sp. SPP-AMP-3]